MSTALVKSLIDEQLEDLEPQLMAFTHESQLGALSLAWDAGIENVHAWSQRGFINGEWTYVYEIKGAAREQATYTPAWQACIGIFFVVLLNVIGPSLD